MMLKLNLCLLKNVPVWQQLAIEEALLRADNENWCVINEGSAPAIVFGISGKINEHIDTESVKKNQVTVVRRFSGGGTVVVDESTFFVSFIFQKDELHLDQCPKKLLEWTRPIYLPVFYPQEFIIRENDYALKNKKIGGNAQYFTKTRALHHTTFLWDYKKERMDLLKMPPKIPEWRKERRHEDFVDCLKHYYPSMSFIKDKLIDHLHQQFQVDATRQAEIPEICLRPHRKATELINF